TGTEIDVFQASPAILDGGGSTVLSWSGVNVQTFSISGVGVVNGTSTTVSPSETTAYLLTATSTGGLTNTSDLIVWRDPPSDAAALAAIGAAVDANRLQAFVSQASGATPVTIDGQSVTIDERYTAPGKARFRSFLAQSFAALNLAPNPIAYPTSHTKGGDVDGHNLEFVLPGKSKDTVVVLTHYDSTGNPGVEARNPAADDNMTGMAQ